MPSNFLRRSSTTVNRPNIFYPLRRKNREIWNTVRSSKITTKEDLSSFGPWMCKLLIVQQKTSEFLQHLTTGKIFFLIWSNIRFFLYVCIFFSRFSYSKSLSVSDNIQRKRYNFRYEWSKCTNVCDCIQNLYLNSL